MIRTAWVEHPTIAIQLTARFTSAQLYREIHTLLLNAPEAAINEPDALQILLGSSISSDVGPKLKVSS